MKIKTCDQCGKQGNLWKAKTKTQPGLCKSCALKNSTPIGSIKISTKTIHDEIKPSKPQKTYSIPNVSEKQKERLKQYRKVRNEYFKEHPVCEFPNCNSRDITLHHARGKTGTLLSDNRWFKSLCMPHHRFVEENPLEARKLGLSFNRLDK